MIYYDIEHPLSMTGDTMDDYLRRGWYRIQQTVITTDLIYQGERLLPVFWLRLDLRRFRLGRSARRIIVKNSGFSVHIAEPVISDEIEELYREYSASIDFQVPGTAREYLMGDSDTNAFDTGLIEVRENGRMVAAGFFDSGAQSLAGVLHLYHPSYRRTSPGKYLMLLEILVAMEQGMHYYYPGYISTEIPKYDYKLFPDPRSAEIFIRSNNAWFRYGTIIDELRDWSRTATELINERRNS